VPAAAVNPAFSAPAIERDPARNPTLTRMPLPASDSRKFCACAGPCDDQPMTPICLMPEKACGNSGNRWRPPRTIVSLVLPRVIVSTGKILEVKEIFRTPDRL
jgi:hypothetical protein